MKRPALTALIVVAVACNSGGGSRIPEECVPNLGVTTGSGLQYVDLKCGTGAEAVGGATLTVTYRGRLEDGTVVDSRGRADPFVFSLGAGRVIPGWDEGVRGMKVGGVRELIIPSDLAYGDDGFPPTIPPGATLTFEIELLKVDLPN
jgi:FKBP-type peptidyl-prolyl cis-trans isomerase